MRTHRGSCSLRRSLRSSGLFLQAGCAGAEDLKGVPGRLKPELLTYSVFDLFEFRYKELDRIAAGGANHMMVRSTVQAKLIARDPVVKIDLIGKAALCEELERAIDGRIADAGIALPHQPMQLLGAEMLTRGEKDVEDAVAFGTLLKAFLAEMRSKDSQSFCGQILAIRTHIVDTFFRRRAQGLLARLIISCGSEKDP